MRKLALLATASLIAPAAYAAAPVPCPTGAGAAPNYAASAGGFGVLDGRWYSPNGSAWTPHGINVMQGQEPSAADILAADPGTNFVRLAIYDYASPQTLAPYIQDLTSHGIFVEIEDHNNGAGNAGGGQGQIFTGQALATELSWYASVAGAFKNNPYVGFGTNNEPSEINPATGQTDPAALSDWQLQTYQAIRHAGNNSPIWLETIAWADPGSVNQGFKTSDYAQMTNVAWDQHIYPWLFNSGASAQQNTATIQQFAAQAQKITSADGTMPVNVLEYGNSTTGQSIDGNWQETVQAVLDSGLGGAAWAWGTGNPGDGLQNPSTNYGAMVAGYNAASGSTGCPQSPIPDPIMQPHTAVQPTWSAPDISVPASPDVISPGLGSLTDTQGNSYMITADGSVMQGNSYVPGGGGTSQIVIVNGTIYGRDDGHGPVNPGGWFVLSRNGYWTPAAPPLGASQAPSLFAQPVTAPALAPASTIQTAPVLAASPLSVEQVAALAAKER
jgi:hypothetical protein